MKELFEAAKIELITICAEDIVTTSPVVETEEGELPPDVPSDW